MRDSKIVEVIAFSLGDETHPPCLVMERMRETLYDFLGVDALVLPLAMKASLSLDVCEVSLSLCHQSIRSVVFPSYVHYKDVC